MSGAIPQNVALHLQLAALAGQPAASWLEIRWKRPDAAMLQEFWPARAHKAIGERVRALAERGDVYVGAAPRVRKQGTKDAVHRGWILWIDLDEPDAIDLLEAFTPAPSIVLLTGSPGHALAIWPLRTALAPEYLVRANRRLAHALGGDLKATDAARIIRVPQTSSHKHTPPTAVECVRLELDVFEARDVIGRLPDPPESTRPSMCATRATPSRAADLSAARPLRDDDVRKTIASAVFVPTLTGRPVNNGFVRCPFHANGVERTPSLHVAEDDSGWYCFACDAGGGIIDFGAGLYGIEPRGRNYHELRRRLTRDLLAGVA